jgi:hypothetical protein
MGLSGFCDLAIDRIIIKLVDYSGLYLLAGAKEEKIRRLKYNCSLSETSDRDDALLA